MKTSIIKSVGILFMSMFMVAAIQAQYGRQLNKLDLSEEQQTEISALRTEHHKTITPLKNKMAELKARERTLLSEENVDLKAVNMTIDEQTELASSIRKLQVKQQLAIKELLTDEQVMKLQQRRMFAHRDGFYGKGGQRDGQRDGQRGGQRSGRPGRGYSGI